jgi:Autophagy receptor ATG43
MSSSVPTQIAETIQTAHINRAPSARHDINPSTAASKKEPVILQEVKRADPESLDDEDDDVPFSEIKPKPRSANMPPMPDLRFEQSYLHSIAKADTYGKVAWITFRDQV